MPRRIATAALAAALACTAGAASGRAHTPADTSASGGVTTTSVDRGAASSRDAARGEKLKGDISRLVADARAGKVGVTTHPRRQQPAQSNNLSKGTKITIAVVVAAVVITAVVIAVKANDAPGDIRIF